MNVRIQQTETQIIIRHTDFAMACTGLQPKAFTIALVAEYHATTAPDVRQVIFRVDGPADAALKHNIQIMKRCRAQYEDNALRFPLDLRRAWIAALPEPHRSDCRRELAAADGMLYVPLPEALGLNDVQRVSVITQQFAGLLSAVAPTMADLVIDARDEPHVPAALSAIDALIGGLTSLRSKYQGAAS